LTLIPPFDLKFFSLPATSFLHGLRAFPTHTHHHTTTYINRGMSPPSTLSFWGLLWLHSRLRFMGCSTPTPFSTPQRKCFTPGGYLARSLGCRNPRWSRDVDIYPNDTSLVVSLQTPTPRLPSSMRLLSTLQD